VREGVDYSLYEEKIMEAAKNCPVGVIKYEEVWFTFPTLLNSFRYLCWFAES